MVWWPIGLIHLPSKNPRSAPDTSRLRKNSELQVRIELTARSDWTWVKYWFSNFLVLPLKCKRLLGKNDQKSAPGITYFIERATFIRNQGGERLGGETSAPLFIQCVMRSRAGTSALSALPARFKTGAGEIFCLQTGNPISFFNFRLQC